MATHKRTLEDRRPSFTGDPELDDLIFRMEIGKKYFWEKVLMDTAKPWHKEKIDEEVN